jgi:hypothetical protein
MTFGYLWTLLAVCVEQLIMGHAYDEYSVLAEKPGMTHTHTSQKATIARGGRGMAECSPLYQPLGSYL